MGTTRRDVATSKIYEWFKNLLALVRMVIGCRGVAEVSLFLENCEETRSARYHCKRSNTNLQILKVVGGEGSSCYFLGVVQGILFSIWIVLSMKASLISRLVIKDSYNLLKLNNCLQCLSTTHI